MLYCKRTLLLINFYDEGEVKDVITGGVTSNNSVIPSLSPK